MKPFQDPAHLSRSTSSFPLFFHFPASAPSLPASLFKTGGLPSRRSFYGRICNFKLTGSRREAPTKPLALQRGSRTVKFRGPFYCPLYGARYADKKMMEVSPDRH